MHSAAPTSNYPILPFVAEPFSSRLHQTPPSLRRLRGSTAGHSTRHYQHEGCVDVRAAYNRLITICGPRHHDERRLRNRTAFAVFVYLRQRDVDADGGTASPAHLAVELKVGTNVHLSFKGHAVHAGRDDDALVTLLGLANYQPISQPTNQPALRISPLWCPCGSTPPTMPVGDVRHERVEVLKDASDAQFRGRAEQVVQRTQLRTAPERQYKTQT